MDDDRFLEKSAMRRRLRARRRGLGLDPVQAGHDAAANFPWTLIAEARPPVVAGYRARIPEIDPVPLLARLNALGARIVLPAVVGRAMPLVFRDAGDSDDHVPDAAGILAPPPSASTVMPSLVIVPVLAFDRGGGRLGQGGGYYDRTLSALRAAGPIWVVGLAYAAQEAPAVPMSTHDQRLDAILTERAYIPVSIRDGS